MTLYLLTLATALLLSGVAAYFSVVGLIAIFAAVPIPIAVMGGTLEIAKLVAASWVYRNWVVAPKILKYYFTVAVLVLSFITSMGIFGYLSKAHLDQNLPAGEITAKLSLIDEKIKTAKENIDANRKALKQMDEAVDQVMGRSTTETGAERSVQIRRQQGPERQRLIREIEAEQKKISALNEERAPIAAEVRKVEAEVGPIKYIASFIYGDNPDTNLLEQAVRWIIIIIVIVFDPMAILLLIAANFTYRQMRGELIVAVEKPVETSTNFFKQDLFVEEPVTTNNKVEEIKEPEVEKRKWSPELYARVKRILYPYKK